MAQKLVQTQEQKLAQVMRLSQQQMLQVHLLEMPLTELEEKINTELDDNPALESDDSEIGLTDSDDNFGDLDNDSSDFDVQTEKEERQDALDAALESIGGDDAMPQTPFSNSKDNADYEEIIYGDTTSFYDRLKEQMDMMSLNSEQHEVMEYLIGSLDDDGLLRKDLDTISDELAIYHNIDVSKDEIGDILKMLQSMDPAGIGARSLQECLLLQVERMREDSKNSGNARLLDAMQTVFNDYFDEFTKKHWDKIQAQMLLNDTQIDTLRKEIRKLNPKPGAALGETEGINIQQITPDFIVDTTDDGSVSFILNQGNIPELKVSPTFSEMVDTYKNNKEGMNRQTKEALLYAKEKVDKAQGFIDAIKQRRHTLTVTMKAIINWQRKFFQDGDESDLKPMILKDIADKTGLDISTISRVSNVKYAQTRWGIFPLRFFFTDSYTTDDGEEMSTRKIKLVLKEVIDNEDKKKPLSDGALAKIMKEKGYPIARRTIAKYREQMNLPVARLRRY
ncbi:MAG: RNA polymerase factor sigma-54 [Prevotella sp.]|jgi:RNA polymerase sigma-54 factor|nr:RNA polymerase factor sigma-54 [Prevotella sp.]MBP8037998.1 RNA polymerase factor sigma-54 [Prevotella sp.]MBP8757232.1 RNA polymerase factor sigma-54 [Prevotella sp.]MBP9985155.1 RNA polymerase factor sigma-54 [Prevotella sp.]MDY0153503.1 RNA polymerase factor sigma-54 [Prevotella sp.]